MPTESLCLIEFARRTTLRQFSREALAYESEMLKAEVPKMAKKRRWES